MLRDLPPPAVPDSLRSVLAAAGYGTAPTEEPVVPEVLSAPAEMSREPLLVETDDPDLPPEPEAGDEFEPEAEDEATRLDPARAADDGIEPPLKAAAAVRPRGPVASVAVHAAMLVAIFDWGITPVDPPQPIPVTMVIERPQPAIAEAKAQANPPPATGLLASEDRGDPSAQEAGSGAPTPSEAPKAEAVPPPPPIPDQKPQQADPKPAKDKLAMMVPPPKPTPPSPPQPKPEKEAAAPPHPAEQPHRAAHLARVPGPAATRDEYLAYLLVLTKQHMDLLPMSAVGGRSGETVLAILVLDDGTISRIKVAQSSGFSDIDQRIEQMVAAVGHFPALPQWYQGPNVELNLRLRFPEALEE